jgi:hypothetical protein
MEMSHEDIGDWMVALLVDGLRRGMRPSRAILTSG